MALRKVTNLKCFNDKGEHQGQYLQEIHKHQGIGFNEGFSVKWCPICGAVVVDTILEDNTKLGHMRFPEIIPLYERLCDT